MADILIRGMDKPGSCHECDFCEVQDINFETLYFCNRNDRFLDDEEACNIPSDCPLHELPEHGDLIDRDALFKQMGVTDMDCYKCEFGNHGFCGRGEFSAACEAIEDAPVIVPANKEESE